MSDEKRLQSTLDKIYNILTKIEMNTTKLQKDVQKLQNESKNVDMKETELTGVYMTGHLEYTDKEIRIKYEDDGK